MTAIPACRAERIEVASEAVVAWLDKRALDQKRGHVDIDKPLGPILEELRTALDEVPPATLRADVFEMSRRQLKDWLEDRGVQGVRPDADETHVLRAQVEALLDHEAWLVKKAVPESETIDVMAWAWQLCIRERTGDASIPALHRPEPCDDCEEYARFLGSFRDRLVRVPLKDRVVEYEGKKTTLGELTARVGFVVGMEALKKTPGVTVTDIALFQRLLPEKT